MSEVATTSRSRYLERPSSSSLADVVNIILDKGLVIDAFVRVSVVGIELITIDARIVIASVDTYLRFAEATNRLDLEQTGGRELPEFMEELTEKGSHSKSKGVISGAKEALTGGKDDRSGKKGDEEDEKQPARARRRSSRQEES